MRLYEFNNIDLQKMTVEELELFICEQLDEMIDIADKMINEQNRAENKHIAQ